MADLLVIVPTRSRPGNVERVIEAWHATDAFAVAELLVAYDADDPRRDEYAQVVGNAPTGVSGSESAEWMPMVAKLNRVAVTQAGSHFALGFAGDDHLPRTTGWARRYVAELRDMRTGIAYCDDLYQGAKLPTQWVMTADIVAALGRMVPAPVEHLYCDDSVLDLGVAAGCIRYLPDAVIEHVNPYAGKTPMDEQYKRVNSRDQYQNDGVAYRRWKADQLPADAEVVRALTRRPAVAVR